MQWCVGLHSASLRKVDTEASPSRETSLDAEAVLGNATIDTGSEIPLADHRRKLIYDRGFQRPADRITIGCSPDPSYGGRARDHG